MFKFFNLFKKKKPIPRTEPCPKCGTMDCIPKSEIGIRGAGQLYVVGGSNAIAKTCRFRQDILKYRQYKEAQETKRVEDKWLN